MKTDITVSRWKFWFSKWLQRYVCSQKLKAIILYKPSLYVLYCFDVISLYVYLLPLCVYCNRLKKFLSLLQHSQWENISRSSARLSQHPLQMSGAFITLTPTTNCSAVFVCFVYLFIWFISQAMPILFCYQQFLFLFLAMPILDW